MIKALIDVSAFKQTSYRYSLKRFSQPFFFVRLVDCFFRQFADSYFSDVNNLIRTH